MTSPEPTNEYFLEKAHLYVDTRPTILSTVVGSGVAVCLYDRIRRMGGMNNHSHPFTDDPKKATVTYGNVAVSALIKMFLSSGSLRENLEAQIFGGAAPDETSYDVRRAGVENIRVAKTVLRRYHIPIVSEDVGGMRGRKIVFNSGTGEVAVFKVPKIRTADWYPYRGIGEERA